MDSDRKDLSELYYDKMKIKNLEKDYKQFKKIVYIFFILIIIIVTSDNAYLGHYKDISYNNEPKTIYINKNNNNSNIYNCSIIESKLNNRLGPF